MAKTIWQLDPAHSEVTFRVRHLVIATVSGKFDKFSADVATEGDDFTTASIAFDVEAVSINTGVEARDNHLRSDDFFNAEKYSLMIFKASSMKHIKGEQYQLEGHLTIRDLTKPISLDVEYGGVIKDPYGNIRAGFEATGKLNRKEYGLRWDALTETGGAVVSDEVKIQVNAQFFRASA